MLKAAPEQLRHAVPEESRGDALDEVLRDEASRQAAGLTSAPGFIDLTNAERPPTGPGVDPGVDSTSSSSQDIPPPASSEAAPGTETAAQEGAPDSPGDTSTCTVRP